MMSEALRNTSYISNSLPSLLIKKKMLLKCYMYLHYLLPCALDNHKSAGPPASRLPSSAYLSSLLVASSISTLSPSYSTTTSPLSISLLVNAQIPAFRVLLGTECRYHKEIAQRISCFKRCYSKKESFSLDYSLPYTKTLEQIT